MRPRAWPDGRAELTSNLGIGLAPPELAGPELVAARRQGPIGPMKGDVRLCAAVGRWSRIAHVRMHIGELKYPGWSAEVTMRCPRAPPAAAAAPPPVPSAPLKPAQDTGVQPRLMGRRHLCQNGQRG